MDERNLVVLVKLPPELSAYNGPGDVSNLAAPRWWYMSGSGPAGLKGVSRTGRQVLAAVIYYELESYVRSLLPVLYGSLVL